MPDAGEPRMLARTTTSTTLPVAAYLAVWALAAIALNHLQPGAWRFTAIFMSAFAGLAMLVWLASRRWPSPVVAPLRARGHAWAVAGYMAFFCLLVVGLAFSWIRELPGERVQAVAMLALKLTTMVVLPLALMRILGMPARLRARMPKRQAIVLLSLVIAVLALVALTTPAIPDLRALAPTAAVLLWAVPFNAAWVALEAALCEEILFRAFLQTQLEAWMKPAAAIVSAALIFGLAHVFGLWLRGDASMDPSNPALSSFAWAAAYSIAILSPPALLFGVLWWRTRNLLLLVVLHASINFLPTLPEFIQLWSS